MAHEIHINAQGKASFAFVGDVAWHGLGQQLTAGAPIPVWVEEAGFNYTIEAAKVIGRVEHSEGYEGDPFDIEMPDRKLLYRSDTHAGLSIVGNGYNVVQPAEVLEFYEDLVEQGGFSLETAGILFGGKRMFALAKVNEGKEVVKGDLVKQYLLLSTACDGTMATQVRNTSVRVVCNNTLQMSFSDSLPMIKIPHSTKFDAKKIKQQLGLIPGSFESFMEDMKELAKRKLTTNEAVAFLVGLVGDPTKKLEDQEVKDANIMRQIYGLFNMDSKGHALVGNTAWGMLNAVTEYTDHHTGHKTDDARLDSAWFGTNANLKQKAYEHLMLTLA